MKKIGVIANCDFLSLPNGGEVFLLHNLFAANVSITLEYYLIGMTFNPDIEEGRWTKVQIGDKTYNFFPVSKVLKDKEKTHIPFRLRVVCGLFKYKKDIDRMKIKNFYIHSAELGIPFWNQENINLIYHVHGDPSQTLKYSRFSHFRSPLWTKLYLKIINKTIMESRLIIWAANKSKELFIQCQPQMKNEILKKSRTIHSSFDYKLHAKMDSIPLLNQRTHFVTVSRLAKIKHIDFIIQSVAQLYHSGVDCDLIICGDGEEMKALKSLSSSLGLEDRIIFLGLCNREQIATVLDAADVFLFASENEAMSLVILESLYMGTPVVSTNVGDISCAVISGETGYIVNSYNIPDYVDKINLILNNGKKFYSEKCKRVAEQYTPDRMASKISKEIDFCLNEVENKKK